MTVTDVRDWMSGKESGEASGNRLRALNVQQMRHALDPAVLDLREPGVEQLVAICEPPLALCAKHGQHRLGDGRCWHLVSPLGGRGQLARP